MATFLNVVIMIVSIVLGVIVGGAATGKFWGGAVGFVAGLMLGELIKWILEKCGVFDRMLDKEIDKSYKKQNKKYDKERERQQAKREKEEAIAKSDREREIRSKANRFLNNPRAEEMVNRCVSQFDFSVPNDSYYYGTDENTKTQTKEEKADFTYYFQVTSDYIRWARNEYSGNWTEFNFQKNGYSSQNDNEKLSSLICAVTEKIKDGYKSRYPSCEVSSSIYDSGYEADHPKGTVRVFVYRQVSNPNYGKTDW